MDYYSGITWDGTHLDPLGATGVAGHVVTGSYGLPILVDGHDGTRYGSAELGSIRIYGTNDNQTLLPEQLPLFRAARYLPPA